MTLAQAEDLALKVLKEVMEEKLDHNNVQLCTVSFILSRPPLSNFALITDPTRLGNCQEWLPYSERRGIEGRD